MPEYLLTVGCPVCDDSTTFVVTTDTPVPVDQDIAVPAEHCPCCGANVFDSAGWDLREEALVERVNGAE